MTDWPLPTEFGAGGRAAVGVDPARASAFVRRLVSAAEAPDGEAAALLLLTAELPAVAGECRSLLRRALIWDALEGGCPPAVRALLRAGGRVWGPGPGGMPVFVRNARVWPGALRFAEEERPDPGSRLYYFRPGGWGFWCHVRRGLGFSARVCSVSLRLSIAALFEAGAPTGQFFDLAARDSFVARRLLGTVDFRAGAGRMKRFLRWIEILYAREPSFAVANLAASARDLRRSAAFPAAEPARQALVARAEALLYALGAWSPLRRSWISAVMRAKAWR